MFLRTVSGVGHGAVITDEIETEWDRHQSSFFRAWRTKMKSRRKLEWLSGCIRKRLRARINDCGLRPAECSAAQKDVHLLEAALAADRIVCSLDSTAHALFIRVAQSYAPLAGIVWANPREHDDSLRAWLENGAKPVKSWQLGR